MAEAALAQRMVTGAVPAPRPPVLWAIAAAACAAAALGGQIELLSPPAEAEIPCA